MSLLPPWRTFAPFAELHVRPESAGRWRGRAVLHVSRLQSIRLGFAARRDGSRLTILFDDAGYMHGVVWTRQGGRWHDADTGLPLPDDPLWRSFLVLAERHVLGWSPRVVGGAPQSCDDGCGTGRMRWKR